MMIQALINEHDLSDPFATPVPAPGDRLAGTRPVGRRLRPVEVTVAYSFVIPLMNEEATIEELYERISAEMRPSDSFEVIFIDDGSSDGSWDTIQRVMSRAPDRVRALRFRRNTGKAAALTAGFRAARGEVVFTLDADLQDDPKEIRRFLAKLDEGYGLVSGWKKVRHDPWHKVLPSRIFNRMLSRMSGVHLHDHNCGFKCYRGTLAKELTLYGELHRMVPALAAIHGFKVAEIVVEHHPRKHGVSKYGFERYLRGFTDMLVMAFLRKYRHRPSHLIAGISAGCAVLAMSLLLAGGVLAACGAALTSLGALICGTVMLATSILAAIGGLHAELTNRGGLEASWHLPIVEDTADRGWWGGTVPPVPTGYRLSR